jgi:hypothetical protein
MPSNLEICYQYPSCHKLNVKISIQAYTEEAHTEAALAVNNVR